MSLRRFVTAAATMIVAVVLAIFVPVAQLPTLAQEPSCCCPQPRKCACPEHKGVDRHNTTMRACHDKAPVLEDAPLPAFVAPEIAVVDMPARPTMVAIARLPEPHPAPAPDRPDGPS